MLSYQHAYHAGSLADIHKHEIFCRTLEQLCAGPASVTCVETHAGRGIYDLGSAESLKTGEAAAGWLDFIKNEKKLATLSPHYMEAVRVLNNGALVPRYPGSPYLAAHILRAKDALYLAELHPTEYAALKKNMGKDNRMQIQKRDGLDLALEIAAQKPGRGLVLVDPSYEVKAEYESIPAFVLKLSQLWPQARILLWTPMLPALRHEAMMKILQKEIPGMQVSETCWAKPGEVRGMYGSIMMGINLPGVF